MNSNHYGTEQAGSKVSKWMRRFCQSDGEAVINDSVYGSKELAGSFAVNVQAFNVWAF